MKNAPFCITKKSMPPPTKKEKPEEQFFFRLFHYILKQLFAATGSTAEPLIRF